MLKIHSELLKLMLDNNRTMTSQQIALLLDVSVRSVKTYITTINSNANAKIILSDKAGYAINGQLAKIYLAKKENDIPQSSEERINYIIRLFLFDHNDFINVNDLCETIFISLTTLKGDIARLNKVYEWLNVQIVLEKECLRLEGNEKNIRKFISQVIYEELGSDYINLNRIISEFSEIDVRMIEKIIRSAIMTRNYIINDIAMVNLVIHIAVIVDRLIDRKYLNESLGTVYNSDGESEFEITNRICKELETAFSIRFIESERREIYLLLVANMYSNLASNVEELKKYVDVEIINKTKAIIHDVEDKFCVNLSDNRFFVSFALHVKNLIYRSENSMHLKNPMLDMILKERSSIFDITLYVSMQLVEKFKINVSMGEMAFIALHIGGELEYQKSTSQKLSTVILCPSITGIDTRMTKEIFETFGSEIEILATVNNLDEVENLKVDLLISTLMIASSERFIVATISPFLSKNDKMEIQQGINACRDNINHKIIKERFDDYFDERLFFVHNDSWSKEAIIESLCETLEHNKVVDATFHQKVLLREGAVSTAFGRFAIPHSIDMDAHKTCIAVSIHNKGVMWNGQEICLVLMIAINKNIRFEFTNLYDGLFDLLGNTENINLISKCKTFSDFRNTINSIIR